MTIFSRKQYEAIAKVINSEKEEAIKEGPEWYDALGNLTDSLIEMFQEDNPRFCQASFLKDCGMESQW